MTPTLWGRWQSRLFLMSTIGVSVTLFFVFLAGSLTPLVILAWVLALGFVWDIIYSRLQTRMWDYDWPIILQITAGIWECVLIFIFIYLFGVVGPPPSVGLFFLHYVAVWGAIFIGSHCLMRIVFPRWRFRGGQLWG